MAVKIKICGIRDRAVLDAAVSARVTWAGFVFHSPSPRNIAIDEAVELARRATAGGIATVGLFVDPADDALAAVLDHMIPDFIQLHGNESPARTAEIRRLTGRPVIKALGVACAADFAAASKFAGVADILLFDAKPPKTGSFLNGGNGISFDWSLCRNIPQGVSWMLSGGLNAENVGEAVRISGAEAVDVSSGVERERGVKTPELVAAFADAARSASRPKKRRTYS